MHSIQSGLNWHGVFFRLLLAFALFALALALAMGAAAYFSAKTLSLEFLATRTDLLLGAVLEAEQHIRSGRESPMDASGLIEPLNLRFLAGKEVDAGLATSSDGIHLLNGGEEFAYIRHIDAIPYVILGPAAGKGAILKGIASMFWVCALAGLCTAIALALFLSRLLAHPAHVLANAISHAGPELRAPIPASLLGRKDEMGVLARTLDQYQTRMDAFIEREKTFTSAASHELRTPLTVISQGLELLEMQTGSDEKSRKLIARLISTSNYMTRVIADLLALARGETLPIGTINPEVELMSALRILDPKAVPESDDRIKEETASILLTGGGHVLIDGKKEAARGSRELAVSVFRNLLENAIRHGQGSDIHVTFAKGQVRIVNNGKYDPAVTGSSGFGLQIARRACEHMGWELRREDYGEKTGFLVTLKPERYHS